MAKSYNTITATDVISPDGAILEVYSCSGEPRALLKQTGHAGAVMNVRPLRWFETVWYKTKRVFRHWFGRPRFARKRSNNVTVSFDPKTQEVVYSSSKKSIRYPI